MDKQTIKHYINPYIGGVALNQLTPAMVDKMFQQIIDKGLKPSTAAGENMFWVWRWAMFANAAISKPTRQKIPLRSLGKATRPPTLTR